jgi:hypothetical protein
MATAFQPNAFQNDAFQIDAGGGTTEDSFTANAVLQRIESASFTADAYLIHVIAGSFSADAVLEAAEAPTPIEFRPAELVKRVSLHILDHRDRPLPAYIPPRIPDQEEDNSDPDPICLPLCEGYGAGFGTGYGAAGGPQRRTITYCSACDVFFRTTSEYLGLGSDIASAEHCGWCGSHQRLSHITKLFVDYIQVPTERFRMRAKLSWDQDTTDSVVVNVYGNIPSLPSVEVDQCLSSLDTWSDGTLLGRMTFIADAEGVLGGRPIQYQTDPSEVFINGDAVTTTIFRFSLANSGTSYNAKFKAANLDFTLD